MSPGPGFVVLRAQQAAVQQRPRSKWSLEGNLPLKSEVSCHALPVSAYRHKFDKGCLC